MKAYKAYYYFFIIIKWPWD